MKLEEAIAKAKILNDSLKELTDEYEGQGSFIAAGMAVSFKLVLDTILTALRPVSREQVEKIYPGCSKCLARGDRNVLNDPGAHDFRLKDSALVYWDEQYGWEGTKVLFCPWCGSPLTDEAVEITMRRLEALNEED